MNSNVKVGQCKNISNIKKNLKNLTTINPCKYFLFVVLSQNISGDLVPLEERDPEHKESYINCYI